jgi:predicted XRE-type DNA-binding protein
MATAEWQEPCTAGEMVGNHVFRGAGSWAHRGTNLQLPGSGSDPLPTPAFSVDKPRANLFLEPGFAPDEAKRLQAASRKQINDARLLKQQLMEELSGWIAEHRLKQSEAAGIPMVSRPRVSDVVNKKTAKFTIDTLVEMLSRVGKPVRLAIC